MAKKTLLYFTLLGSLLHQMLYINWIVRRGRFDLTSVVMRSEGLKKVPKQISSRTYIYFHEVEHKKRLSLIKTRLHQHINGKWINSIRWQRNFSPICCTYICLILFVRHFAKQNYKVLYRTFYNTEYLGLYFPCFRARSSACRSETNEGECS